MAIKISVLLTIRFLKTDTSRILRCRCPPRRTTPVRPCQVTLPPTSLAALYVRCRSLPCVVYDVWRIRQSILRTCVWALEKVRYPSEFSFFPLRLRPSLYRVVDGATWTRKFRPHQSGQADALAGVSLFRKPVTGHRELLSFSLECCKFHLTLALSPPWAPQTRASRDIITRRTGRQGPTAGSPVNSLTPTLTTAPPIGSPS